MWCGEVPAWPGELREMASCVPDGDATAAVLAVPEDLALYIASYLGGEALAQLEATSKACRSLYANISKRARIRVRDRGPPDVGPAASVRSDCAVFIINVSSAAVRNRPTSLPAQYPSCVP